MGVEVGVAVGQTSEALLRARSNLTLYMVDSWAAAESQPQHYRESGDWHGRCTQGEQDAHLQAATNATDFAKDRRIILRLESSEAAKGFGQEECDFVFIDADHTYEGCGADINAWTEKVKKGGWLCGHDYYKEAPTDQPWAKGVKRAVDEAVRKNGWNVEFGENFTWFVKL